MPETIIRFVRFKDVCGKNHAYAAKFHRVVGTIEYTIDQQDKAAIDRIRSCASCGIQKRNL